MPRRSKTTDQFIQESQQKHGDKYDYTSVDYVNAKTKVKIICPIHGVFIQNPNNHRNGAGCTQCAINKRKDRTTKDEFIRKAKKIHEDKYDYSLVNYINLNTKVNIICPIHGVFMQNPHNHQRGTGCPQCGNKRRGEREKPKTTKQFIQDARKAHGDDYDYSLSTYITKHKKVKIICPHHGVFEQRPRDHLKSHGCPQCGKKKKGSSI